MSVPEVSIPEVSIVIPTRNRWSMLSMHALPSALTQEDVDFEVIVVDDASDDETAQRLAATDDPRIKVVRNEERKRLPAARNAGADVARGAWLAFLDDDDLWAPRKLRTQLDVGAEADAKWVYARCVVVDRDLRPIDLHPLPQPNELSTLLIGGNHVPGGGSGVVVRTETFREIGGFDESLSFFEDWDLWLRLIHVAEPAACSEILVARVEHGANMLFRDRADVGADYERLVGKHREVTDSQRLAVAEWLAHEHMRGGYSARAAVLYARAAFRFRSPGNALAALGALFGRRGLSLASRTLSAVGGGTHLDEAALPTPPRAPAWLVERRDALLA